MNEGLLIALSAVAAILLAAGFLFCICFVFPLLVYINREDEYYD